MRNFLSAVAMTTIVLTSCSKTKNNDRVYEVNSTTSVAEWKGSAPDHFHVGSFQVKGAVTTASNGNIKGGSFKIPIASIQDFDLQDPLRQVLLDDLKSANFFNMVLYPNAAFEITSVVNYTGNAGIAGANKMVTGNFSMLGQTHPVSFPARINYVGDSLKVGGTFQIDRSKWGMTTYTDPNAELYIIPNADINLKVQAAIK